MMITNIYRAALEGDLNMFKQFYDGNANYVRKSNGLNLLQAVALKGGNYEERLEIISFLLKEGIDVNFVDKKDKYNALHCLYYKTFYNDGVTDGKYVLTATKMLMDAGIDINCKNNAGSIPLASLIVGKLEFEEMKPIIQLLLDAGSNYLDKNNYGYSCLDYAKKFNREEIVKMLEERK